MTTIRCLTGLLVLGSLLAAASVRGDAQATHVHVFGAGALPCERWTADRAEGGEPYRVDLSWVLGFVTAFEMTAERDMQDTGTAAIDAFVSSYCSRHPLDTVADAASALVADLRFQGSGE